MFLLIMFTGSLERKVLKLLLYGSVWGSVSADEPGEQEGCWGAGVLLCESLRVTMEQVYVLFENDILPVQCTSLPFSLCLPYSRTGRAGSR